MKQRKHFSKFFGISIDYFGGSTAILLLFLYSTVHHWSLFEQFYVGKMMATTTIINSFAIYYHYYYYYYYYHYHYCSDCFSFTVLSLSLSLSLWLVSCLPSLYFIHIHLIIGTRSSQLLLDDVVVVSLRLSFRLFRFGSVATWLRFEFPR